MENFFKVAYKKHQKIFNNWMKVARNRKTLEAIHQIRQWLMKAIVIVILNTDVRVRVILRIAIKSMTLIKLLINIIIGIIRIDFSCHGRLCHNNDT